MSTATARKETGVLMLQYQNGKWVQNHAAACPVPTAIIKEVEVAAKLALPKNVEIELATGSAV
jgi:hypothetical protein